jgi:hypothetical protein
MPASMLFAVLLFAGPHAAPKELSFTPLLEEGAEWSYAAYTEGEKEARSELPSPGELHLRVALVRQVGQTTVIALELLVDGVELNRLRHDVNLDLPFSSPLVLVVSKQGLRGAGLSLEDARTVTEADLPAAIALSSDPLVFPSKPRNGEKLHWKFDDHAQQLSEGRATLAPLQEQVDGHAVDAWAARWRGKGCFAGDCAPFAATQVFSPEAGLVRFCSISFVSSPPMECLRMVRRVTRSVPELVPGVPPSLGELWRVMQTVKPAILACMGSASDISELSFRVEPGGSLSAVKEMNQSGPAAECIVKAAAGVHFPPFKGKPVVLERISFSR